MLPRVDPVKAVDAHLRELRQKMLECKSPSTLKGLRLRLDILLDRRNALTSRAGSQTREASLIDPR